MNTSKSVGPCKTSVVNSFFVTPTNDAEVESLINKMNTSKSVGPYSIPTRPNIP